MASHKQVTRAAGVVGFATVITRIFGFLRDMVIALSFGAGMEADAYFVAFRIPNMLRRLVGEGALTVAFIPVFVEERQKGEHNAWELANTVATLLSLVLIVVTGVGILLSPWVIRVIAPGFTHNPEKFALTTSLTRLMFPYIFFISLAALAMGMLNSLQHFFSPALAPLMLNLTLIGSVLWLCPHLEQPAFGLAVGVLVGGAAQLLFQVPALVKRGFRYRVNLEYTHPAVRKIGVLLLPAFFGLAVNQIAVFVNTLLASYLAEGSVSYLYFSYRVVEFPLGIFGMAVATAVLPTMSAQSANGDYEQLIETLSFALRLVLFITIPSMVGLIVLRMPIVAFLFQRGQFTVEATQATAQALLYYTLGLFAIASVRIIVPVFYSLQDTMTPVKCAAGAVALNIVCSLLLMIPLQHGGLALATSLSAYFNLLLLVWVLRKRLGKIGWRRILRSLGKVTLASIVMGACCAPFVGLAMQQIWVFLAVMAGGALVFLGCAWFLQSEEFAFLLELLVKRKGTESIP
ncbi:murein biosynthesis integral membrane protein MurJ [candidate division KSB3 bacterium]|uniref:Probable lipid II flippase MurJ n=1 Tax=candidate division KSB3 bacterium TaxID=2044937 RepID=A0A9D5JYZ5_9BACT|nr:murein biosynthesis integral membrane protein MurJ [candidate division KSB3 bacterium]MBD3326755.1 murein biosynthesis integral membrane protein MurJ [candidate division KSB3 bacterium]